MRSSHSACPALTFSLTPETYASTRRRTNVGPPSCPPGRAGAGSGFWDHRLGPCYVASIAPPWATGGADEDLPSTARIHRWARRRRGLAAGGVVATAVGAGDWLSQLWRTSYFCGLGVPQGLE